jgi:hypothetical protein
MAARSDLKTLFIAEAFGFGPASKLLILARQLRARGNMTTTYLGDGCSYELCSAGPFDTVMYGDPTDLRQEAVLYQQLISADVLVSSMEFKPLATARNLGLTTILFDSLFWMWPDLSCDPKDVDLYICQNFLGVKDRVSELERSGNFLVVPPLTLAEDCEWRGGGTVLLNFGGMDNPYADKAGVLGYAACMLRVLLEECRRWGLGLEVCGRSWVNQQLGRMFSDDFVCFGTLAPEAFVARLRQARCLVTSPGLETLYEAFTLGIPTFILPAQNNSQAYQAHRLRRDIPRLAGVEWRDILETDLLERPLAPAELTQQTLACAARLEGDASANAMLRDALREFLQQDAASLDRQRREQFEFIGRMRRTADVQWVEVPSLVSWRKSACRENALAETGAVPNGAKRRRNARRF